MSARTETARLPSLDELEGATHEIARALDAIDTIRTAVVPPPAELPPNAGPAARLREVADRSIDLSVGDVGRLFLFANDAATAAETLRRDAEAILAELPDLWHDRVNAKGEWS